MSTNPLKALPQLGQSIWLDYIRRDMLEDGTLQRLIDEDALMGMTTNDTAAPLCTAIIPTTMPVTVAVAVTRL